MRSSKRLSHEQTEEMNAAATALYSQFVSLYQPDGDTESPVALSFFKKIVTYFLADHKQKLDLSRQTDDIISLLFDAALRVQENTRLDEQLYEDTIAQIELIIEQKDFKRDAAYAADSTHFNADDKKPLFKHPNHSHVLLTHDHLESLMPAVNNTSALRILSPVRMDALDSHQETVNKAIANPDVKSIVIPVGPTHWRLIHIQKENDSNKIASISLFDSFGKTKSAKLAADKIANILNFDRKKIELIGPTNKQNDGHSCGDFVVAQVHKIAKTAKLPHEPAFVNALNQGQSLRPLMIAKSKSDPVAALPQSALASTPASVETSKPSTSKIVKKVKKKEKAVDINKAIVKTTLTFFQFKSDSARVNVEKMLNDIIKNKQQERPMDDDEQKAVAIIQKKDADYQRQLNQDEMLAKKLQAEEIELAKNLYVEAQESKRTLKS